MESNDTRDRIPEAALDIFPRDGYAGANLKGSTGAVGVVKSGLHRHYASKEELWDAVLDEVERLSAGHIGSEKDWFMVERSKSWL